MHTLRSRAVRPCLWRNVALSASLNSIVADGGRRAQAFLDIAGFEQVPLAVRMMGPYARENSQPAAPVSPACR
jgi:hypothetical protein